MTESCPKVPQAGIDFIRDIAEDDVIDSLAVRGGPFHQGECVFEKSGKNGAWICEFVIEPGPNAKRVILTQQAGERHPVVAAVHRAVEYRQTPGAVDEHWHAFASEREALTTHDAVTAIMQLGEMCAGF